MQYIPSAQFIAGTEPTTSVLSFALLYMVREPEVQDRVRAEIHDVLGKFTTFKTTKTLSSFHLVLLAIHDSRT